MFEAQTYEKLLEDVLAKAPDGIDTRKGSIFYDAVAACVNKIAKLYTDLDRVFELVFITTASGEYLDMRAQEYGMARNSATPAKLLFTYTGTRPAAGWRFFHNDTGYYFTLVEESDGTLYLEAEEAGAGPNEIQSGDIAVPCDTVTGMTSANFAGIYEYGIDAEEDDDLRQRVMEKIAGPAENGNKQHYKTWCESVTGVGQARIDPLWNGENTVKGVLISPLGLPVPESVVEEVQNYIDPNDIGMTVTIAGKTYNVGDGLGNGKANIGAHFTAVAAEAATINVKFSAEIVSGQTPDTVAAAAEDAITDYLKELVNSAEGGTTIIVRVSAVGAILAGLTTCIVDYTDLKLNGEAENIRIADDAVPVLGEVSVDVVS